MDGFNWKHIFLSDDFMASDALQLYTDAATTKGFADVFLEQSGSCMPSLKVFKCAISTCFSYSL